MGGTVGKGDVWADHRGARPVSLGTAFALGLFSVMAFDSNLLRVRVELSRFAFRRFGEADYFFIYFLFFCILG